MRLKEKICKLNRVFQATELIFILKFATEVDECGHADRNINNEIERKKALQRELNCVFIRINLNKKDFNNFKPLNEIQTH